MLAERLLAPVKAAGVDTLLLGCTHYPFLARTIGDVMGRDVVLVSSADETAFEVRAILEDTGLGRRSAGKGGHRWISSGDAETFRQLGRRLFGPEIDEVEPWDPSDRRPDSVEPWPRSPCSAPRAAIPGPAGVQRLPAALPGHNLWLDAGPGTMANLQTPRRPGRRRRRRALPPASRPLERPRRLLRGLPVRRYRAQPTCPSTPPPGCGT